MTALLAFDCATERLHVGLAVDDRLWLHECAGGAHASSSLIPTLRELLGQARIGLDALDAIAFGRGPGAFTGLRTACATAQGLALGARKPVLAIDTLLAIAEDARARAATAEVWVAMDARMGEIYGAHYGWADGAWRCTEAPALYTPEQLNSLWLRRPPAAIAGSAAAAFGASLDTGAALVVAEACPSAHALLACARAAWAAGTAVDAAAALPLYLRNRVALTTAERAAGHRLAP